MASATYHLSAPKGRSRDILRTGHGTQKAGGTHLQCKHALLLAFDRIADGDGCWGKSIVPRVFEAELAEDVVGVWNNLQRRGESSYHPERLTIYVLTRLKDSG